MRGGSPYVSLSGRFNLLLTTYDYIRALKKKRTASCVNVCARSRHCSRDLHNGHRYKRNREGGCSLLDDIDAKLEVGRSAHAQNGRATMRLIRKRLECMQVVR